MSLEPYKHTPWFFKETTPKALLRDHSTKAGVWGMIEVRSGSVLYEEGGNDMVLGVGEHQVISPQVAHHVTPSDDCEFRVVFLREASAAGGH